MISRTTNVAALLRSQIDRFGLQLKHLEHTRWRLRVARHALEKLRATAGLSLPHVKPKRPVHQRCGVDTNKEKWIGIRPHVGTALAAGLADETMLNVGQAKVIGPLIGA